MEMILYIVMMHFKMLLKKQKKESEKSKKQNMHRSGCPIATHTHVASSVA